MSGYTHLIIGLGKTGWSVAHYFSTQGFRFRLIDTRLHPPQLTAFQRKFPDVPLYRGGIIPEWVKSSQEIILSPGIDPQMLNLQAINPNAKIYSDIDLFNRAANAPIIAITGSNGKSTVTLLIHHLLQSLNKQVKVGGNLGTPALDLLTNPPPDFYILELSSFQLSTTKQLKTVVSVLLNCSTNHLERHGSLTNYYKAKQTIYRDCQVAIWNRDDRATYPQYPVKKIIDFGKDASISTHGFGIVTDVMDTWLTQGALPLMKVKSLQIKGVHNYLNILAALAAIQAAVDCQLSLLLEPLSSFKGLPHRLEKIGIYQGVTWINDSKATNSHATQAALASLAHKNSAKKTVILIMGGLFKKGDNPKILVPFLVAYVKRLILIGKDAMILRASFLGIVPIDIVSNLAQAVQKASNYAVSGDIIMLSPACASQDMFQDYRERGNSFKSIVKNLLKIDSIL
jgi:UDP-N-acetylmuramoylalanine--D-glutamate ligase